MPDETARPGKIPLPDLATIPASLHSTGWLCWRYVWNKAKSKWTKPPYSARDGQAIGSDEAHRSHLVSLAEALATAERFDGIGRVLEGLVGIDFDDCLSPEHVILDEDVQNYSARFLANTYGEVSPSGTGLHFIATGKIPRALNEALGNSRVEVYSGFGRYFTFTGKRFGTAGEVTDCQEFLNRVYKKFNIIEIDNVERRPLTIDTIRRLHQANLSALRSAPHGAGNAALNNAAFFAAKALAAGALEQTEAEVRKQLLDIVTKEWHEPHDERGAIATINSGWRKGIDDPIEVKQDETPELTELISQFNDRYFLIRKYGNKARVGRWEKDLTARHGKTETLEVQAIHEFKNGYLGDYVVTGYKENNEAVLSTRAEAWLRSPNAKRYDSVVFLPNETVAPDVLNMWRGFAFTPKQGDCSLYLSHIRENVCQGDAVSYDFLIKWMAHAVQYPGEQGFAAITVSGKKGVGKNVFAEKFGHLWGNHSMTVSSSDRVTGNFNKHLQDKCLLVADEAFFAASKRQDNVLKSLVTGPTLTIEAKGVDTVTARNLLHIIILGNAEWLVQATGDERRYLSLECADTRKEDTDYFEAISRQMSNGGYSALLWHLLYMDLTGFNVRRPPHTDALRKQMTSSTDGVLGLWQEILASGRIPGKLTREGIPITRPDIIIVYANELKNRQFMNLRECDIRRFLGIHGLKFTNKLVNEKGVRSRYSFIPPLPECRRFWDETYFKIKWDDATDEWAVISEEFTSHEDDTPF